MLRVVCTDTLKKVRIKEAPLDNKYPNECCDISIVNVRCYLHRLLRAIVNCVKIIVCTMFIFMVVHSVVYSLTLYIII